MLIRIGKETAEKPFCLPRSQAQCRSVDRSFGLEKPPLETGFSPVSENLVLSPRRGIAGREGGCVFVRGGRGAEDSHLEGINRRGGQMTSRLQQSQSWLSSSAYWKGRRNLQWYKNFSISFCKVGS
eukprot:3465255-Rhodomonas_salina.3